MSVFAPRMTAVLSDAELGAVHYLVAAATRFDGWAPLNDEAGFALAPGGEMTAAGRHWLIEGKPAPAAAIAGTGAAPAGADLIAYAYDAGAAEAPIRDIQLVVAPAYRRQGWGYQLAQAITQASPESEFWAFGDSAAAQALAGRLGYGAERVLLQLTRAAAPSGEITESSGGEPGGAAIPAGITIRGYREDDAAGLLAVNSRAFAHHPEQGRWQRADLDQRLAADWFDPQGLLVATLAVPADPGGGPATEQLAGFHWTKLESQAGRLLGEVYVLAVDPAMAGHGLGKALLAAGLDYLAAQGAGEVILYVEADQPVPLHLYQRAGFWISRRDVRYASKARLLVQGRGL